MLRQPQRRFAMDAILGQFLAFDLARNLAAILAFHLAEILAILWYNTGILICL